MGASSSTVRERKGFHAPAVPPSRWPAIPGFKPRAEDAFAHLLARIPAARLLLGAAGASALIYALFVLAFPITRWWDHPHVGHNPNAITDMGAITGYSPLAAAAYVAAVLALFLCQFLAMSAVSRREVAPDGRLTRAALAVPVVFALILIWMEPVTSTDLYGYVARGYLYARLHFNPMTTPAFLLPGQLLVSRPAAPYGPAWLLICGAVLAVTGEHLLLAMLAFKAIAVAALLASCWLIHAIAVRLCPQVRVSAVMFFAWNPLVLFEVVGNGHNDILMMACVLAALLLMAQRRARGAFALLVLGALVKYFAALLIPLWLVYELAQRRRRAEAAASRAHGAHPRRGAVARAGSYVVDGARSAALALRDLDRGSAARLIASSGAIGAVLVAGFYLPFWDGLTTFSGLGQQLRPLYYNGSLVQFIAAPLELLVAPSSYAALDKTIRLLFYTLFGLYAAIQTYRLWRAGTDVTLRDLITAGAKIVFAALLLVAFWFQPWYVVWLIPLAALADDAFVRSQTAILSGGSLLTYAVANFLFVHETGIGQSLFVQFFEVLVAFLPLLLLRVSPAATGWRAIARSYLDLLGEGLRRRAQLWDRVMLGMILVVAIILRLVRLGNPFGTISPDDVTGQSILQVSADLRLILADPSGLEGPFGLLQRACVAVFGPTPFAILLPSAVIGSLTVLLIYLVTTVLLSDGPPARARAIGLLAALLAATSEWHVSLSRSGVQVVALPLLLCLALYLLLLALRTPVPARVRTAVPRPARPSRRHAGRRHGARRPAARAPRLAPAFALDRAVRRRLLLFAGGGAAIGVASDLAPGLWVLPLLVVATFALVRRQQPARGYRGGAELAALVAATLVAALPGVWHFYLSPYVGFPAGSGALAQTSPAAHAAPPAPGAQQFLAQAAHNVLGALSVLTAQDYSAGWPSSGGTPIIPPIMSAFFYVGIVLILLQWRRFSSMAQLLLLALPLVASLAVGTQPSVIQAASILPAVCIVPAVALYSIGGILGRLPIVFDRAHGVRVFANPEYIGRIMLMTFLAFSALRTFYWYFQATLPTTPLNTTIAS